MTDYEKIYETYKSLSSADGRKYATPEEFQVKMQNNASRMKLYQYLKFNETKLGVDFGSQEGFEQRILPQVDSRYKDVTTYDDSMQYKKETPWWDKLISSPLVFNSRLAKNLLRGAVTQNVSAIGGVLRALGYEDTGTVAVQVAKNLDDNYLKIHNPDFFDQVMQGFGSTATFFVPGLGIAKGAQAMSAVPRLARLSTWLGVGYASVTEGSVEAGMVYNEMINKGKSKAEARTAAGRTFVGNLVVNPILDTWIFRDTPVGKRFKSILIGSGSEGLQESLQEIISSLSMDELPTGKQLARAAGVGAIVGGVGGGVKPMEQEQPINKGKHFNYDHLTRESLQWEIAHRASEKATVEHRQVNMRDVIKSAHEMIFDISGPLKGRLWEENKESAEPLILRKNLTYGASPAAMAVVNEMKHEIFDGVDAEHTDWIYRVATDIRSKELFRKADAAVKNIKSKMRPEDVAFMEETYGNNWQRYIKDFANDMFDMQQAWFDRIPDATKQSMEDTFGSDWKSSLKTMLKTMSNFGAYWEGQTQQDRAAMSALFGIPWEDLAVVAEFTRPGHMTPQMIDAAWAEMPQDLKSVVFPRAEKLMGAFDGIIDLLEGGGILDGVSAANMRQYKYLPTLFIDKLDPFSQFDVKYYTISVKTSGLKKTKQGAESPIRYDYDKLLEYVWIRAYKRVMDNNANIQAAKYAAETPNSKFIRVGKWNPVRRRKKQESQTPPLETGVPQIEGVPVEEKPTPSQITEPKSQEVGYEEATRKEIQPTLPVKLEPKSPLTGSIAERQTAITKATPIEETGKPEWHKGPLRDKIPPGWVELNYFHPSAPGRVQSFYMPKEWAEEWSKSVDPPAQWLRKAMIWGSGTAILRPFATGYLNPFWGILTNMPVDLAYVLHFTNEFSPVMPIATAQLGRQLLRVAPDVFMRRGKYLEAIAQGLGLEFLTHQGTTALTPHGLKNHLEQWLGYLNETTEIWTRLALREQALERFQKQGIPLDEAQILATGVARSYIDFSQGGYAMRNYINNLVPYSNAAAQAGIGVARAFKRNPYETSAKMVQFMMLSAGLAAAFAKWWPEETKHISKYHKAQGWNFPIPGSAHLDDQGRTRYNYLHVRLPEPLIPLKTLVENAVHKSLGLPVDNQKAADVAKQVYHSFLPTLGVANLPPLWKGILGYATDKDFWTLQEMSPYFGKVHPYAERDKTTAGFYDFLGDVSRELKETPTGEQFGFTGISPRRAKYFASSVIPSGNFFSQLVGMPLNEMFKKLPPEQQQEYGAVITKALQKSMGSSVKESPVFEQLPQMEKIIDMDKTLKGNELRINAEFDDVLGTYMKTKTNDSHARFVAFLNEHPQDRERLLKRRSRIEKLHRVSDANRALWYGIQERQTPEARAAGYYIIYNAADDVEKLVLRREVRMVPGLFTEKFQRALHKLQIGDQK